LLTGATGFLGVFLLRDLLRETRAQIHCLVRCRDSAAGRAKIRANLESFELWEDSFTERIVPVPGDLAQPLLGLSPEAFARLAAAVDSIYHNGALVNFAYPYAMLEAANVRGTQEVLRLACLERIKPVHYVSTLSVFPASGIGQDVFREEPTTSWTELVDGYSQSKWVAEQLVVEAGRRGLPVGIYRPGRITGHSQTGACGKHDLIVNLLRDLLQLGAVPDLDTSFEMTPVDYVSRAIVYLSRQMASRGQIFHLTNPQSMPLQQMVEVLDRSGYPVRVLPFLDWVSLIEDRNGASQGIGVLTLLGLRGGVTAEQFLAMLQPQHFDCTRTLAALAESDIRYPPADKRLLETTIGFLAKSGWLSSAGGEVATMQALGVG